jgi:hypothetical protein
MECGRINDVTATLTDELPGLSHFLEKFSTARKQVEESLTDDQRQIYRVLAKDWTANELPPEMKQWYAHGNGSSRLELADFSTLV